ncbi:SGNH/GDSL hydrolase family protein [Legionella sp. PATHC035]|uniref:SGNH/GDSL hydrolase family protein n=1 Tax=Legionella sp. PATHC035 TaxID=2992040 RepID=UPI0022441C7E|nr:SGNH/GDSL hydrolase family protein [Legionella sp. PATHC035]MCW8410265.1 SGNH/GDSL hydrolase family protein [Legionella sp. PATHC035]
MAESKKEPKSISVSKHPKEINYFVIFGDSLSDGKNMGEKATFLGPLAKKLWLKITGLSESPKERFTNGYTWADAIKSMVISKFLNEDRIKKDPFGKFNLNNADISDDILSRLGEDQDHQDGFSWPHKRQYTKKEVRAEINEVRRKKRVEAREEGHLFGANPENSPKSNTISSQDKKTALGATPIKKGRPKTKLQESSDDVADQLITDSRYHDYVQEYYSLDDGRVAQYNGQNFFRNYSQGGSTSYDYSWNDLFLSLLSPITSIKLFFTRLIVSNLSNQVDQFLQDSENEEAVSIEQKKKTLITVFSGANDLITVNSEPTEEAAKLAAQSNIDNIERLIKKGYTNFVLCNLPDLSLTPRYQNKSVDERNNAQTVSIAFNTELEKKLEKLKERYPNCSIDLFDIKSVFTKIYNDVRDDGGLGYSQYFNKSCLKEPYLDYAKKNNIPIIPGGVAPGYQHMFWDDVHPTATMHALLMSEYYKSKEGLAQYKISAPAEQSAKLLCNIFNRKYHEKLEELTFGPFSWCNEFSINYEEPKKALISILRYALVEQNDDGDCLREAMADLGWWANGKPNMSIPALADAMWLLDPEYARRLEAKLDPHLREPNSYKMIHGALGGTLVDQEPLKNRAHPELDFDPEVDKKLQKLMDKKANTKEPEPTLLQATTTSTLKQRSLTTEDITTLTL